MSDLYRYALSYETWLWSTTYGTKLGVSIVGVMLIFALGIAEESLRMAEAHYRRTGRWTGPAKAIAASPALRWACRCCVAGAIALFSFQILASFVFGGSPAYDDTANELWSDRRIMGNMGLGAVIGIGWGVYLLYRLHRFSRYDRGGRDSRAM